MADEHLLHGNGERSNATSLKQGRGVHKNKKACRSKSQLTRFQVWPPQNIPPNAQPCTRIAFGPFMAIVES
ncbi:hypothetical protein ACVWZ4_004157 [Bradyrhizobium sp. USDA 4472]